ncbi:MAG: hypothetical protein O7A04_12345 [Acidobacteria bacterium]|nr:hypothetical protein [Acidobacteriota bacterium]
MSGPIETVVLEEISAFGERLDPDGRALEAMARNQEKVAGAVNAVILALEQSGLIGRQVFMTEVDE